MASLMWKRMVLGAAVATMGAMGVARAAEPVADGKPHKLELKDRQFKIDGQPIRLIAGEMHPGRIQPEFWEDRIKKAKAMGLNTISVYLFWNQMEPKEGEFVFEGITDIRRFVKLCEANGMWVELRVGPYVCAEIEFGGLPSWLLKYHDMKIRADDPKFLGYCERFVTRLGKEVADLQINHGGPIVLTQFENEYQNINDYLRKLHAIFVKAGFDGQLMTCDHSGPVWNNKEGIPGVLRGYNGFKAVVPQRIGQAQAVNGDMPVLSPEVYTGWFDLWGGKLMTVSVEQQVSDAEFLLAQKDVSWTFFLVNGGTNFGFSAGSNSGRPMQTTYDYDAPIDELGRITPKFKALREVLAKGRGVTLGEIPADPKVITIPAFTLKAEGALLGMIGEKGVATQDVKPMEDIGQRYGFTLYRTKLAAAAKGKLTLPAARDYVWVMVNGKVIGDGLTAPKTPTFATTIDAPEGATLDVLVENMGRTSSPFDQKNSRKGLEGNPTVEGKPLMGWTMYAIEDIGDLSGRANLAGESWKSGPSLHRGTFTVSAVGETYLDMSKWKFGVVWVNGHNLGRFWDVGASRSLYLPSVWQKQGANEIVVLETGPGPASPQVAGVANMVTTPVKPFSPYWVQGAAQGLQHVEGQGDEGTGLQ
jgi:beta-galactosidase